MYVELLALGTGAAVMIIAFNLTYISRIKNAKEKLSGTLQDLFAQIYWFAIFIFMIELIFPLYAIVQGFYYRTITDLFMIGTIVLVIAVYLEGWALLRKIDEIVEMYSFR
jgi:hypothetical protein